MKPPLLKGGQGRSPKSVEDDGQAVCIGLVALASFLLWALIYHMVWG